MQKNTQRLIISHSAPYRPTKSVMLIWMAELILDATLIQKYVVGIVELSAEQKHLADYNNDGDITVVDATEIQKFIVHLN